MNRETWLNELAALMAPRFADLGHPLPPFRVSVGFVSTGMGGDRIGECWDKTASADRKFEIFIRPDASGSKKVAFILAHELIHAAVGLKEGHKGNFAKVALALGFPRPLTHAGAMTEEMLSWLEPMLAQLGEIPHAPLTWRKGKVERGAGGVTPTDGDGEEGEEGPTSSAPKKQSTRLHKVACAECGYTVRVTAKWLEIGPPHCPHHGAMKAE